MYYCFLLRWIEHRTSQYSGMSSGLAAIAFIGLSIRVPVLLWVPGPIFSVHVMALAYHVEREERCLRNAR